MISRKQYRHNVMKNYNSKDNNFYEKKVNYANVSIQNNKQFVVEGKIKQVRFNNCVYIALIPTREENDILELRENNSEYDNYNEHHHIIKDLPNNIAELDIESIYSIKSCIKPSDINSLGIQNFNDKSESHTYEINEINNQSKIFRFYDDILSYMIK